MWGTPFSSLTWRETFWERCALNPNQHSLENHLPSQFKTSEVQMSQYPGWFNFPVDVVVGGAGQDQVWLFLCNWIETTLCRFWSQPLVRWAMTISWGSFFCSFLHQGFFLLTFPPFPDLGWWCTTARETSSTDSTRFAQGSSFLLSMLQCWSPILDSTVHK